MKKMYAIIEAPTKYRIDLSRLLGDCLNTTDSLEMVNSMGARKIDFQFDIDLSDKEICELVGQAQDIFPVGKVLCRGKVLPLVWGPDEEIHNYESIRKASI